MLKEIVKEGFSLNETRKKGNFEIDLALISLRIALKAYFSTYQTFRDKLGIFHPSANNNSKDTDSMHSIAYCEAYAECIVHFQHFAELVCKNFLRSDHSLLSDTALSRPIILHKLLKGDKLTSEENKNVKSIEFSEALKRIVELIKKKRLKDWQSLSFIENYKEQLEELNKLRNRIWHRGTYILHYSALDKFVGIHIFPFVAAVVSHPAYSSLKQVWKYDNLACGIDPIDGIISAMQNSNNYDIGKIAFLKELGRAAYQSPIKRSDVGGNIPRSLEKLLNQRHIERSVRVANTEAKLDNFKVTNCPVCDVKSLVIEEEIESNDPGGEEWVIGYTTKVKCECCSFELIRGSGAGEIKNASDYGLTSIEDYWITETYQ